MRLAIIDDCVYRYPLIDHRAMVLRCDTKADREAVEAAVEALWYGNLVTQTRDGIEDANVGTAANPQIQPIGGDPVDIDPAWPWFVVRALSEADYRAARRAGGPASRLGQTIAEQLDNPRRYREGLTRDLAAAVARWLGDFEITIDGQCARLELTGLAHDEDAEIAVEAAARKLAGRLVPYVRAPGVAAARASEMVGDRFPEIREALDDLVANYEAERLDAAEADALDAHRVRHERVNDAIARAALVGLYMPAGSSEPAQVWHAEDARQLFDRLVPAVRNRLRESVLMQTGRISNSGKSPRGWRSRSG